MGHEGLREGGGIVSDAIACFNACGNVIEAKPGTFRTTPAAVVMLEGRAESVSFCSERCLGEFVAATKERRASEVSE